MLFFSVGLPRTVCAFVSLTRDNIIEQYIHTFLETPRPNVIQTASHCCFEKFRIKRYPNRPLLDYPLDLTKSTNHKIRKRTWTWARSIQPKFPEISVQNSMDRFGPTGKVSKKRVHLLRWTTFPGRAGWNFGWMDCAKNKENCKFRWPLRKHAVKTVFLWLVHFDPLVKKMSDTNHLSGPLSIIVCDLCLVDFDPFCEFLCFKVCCLWSYCDQNPTLIFQMSLIDFFSGLQTSKFRWGKNTEDSD